MSTEPNVYEAAEETKEDGYYDPKTKTYVVGKEEPKKFPVLPLISMILGIVGAVCCCCGSCIPYVKWVAPFLALLMSVAALVLAIVSKKVMGKMHGMAIAGMILGIFGIVMFVIVLLGLILGGLGMVSLFSDLPGFLEGFADGFADGYADAVGEANTDANIGETPLYPDEGFSAYPSMQSIPGVVL